MRIGIDLGGSKIEGIAIDDGGYEVARKRIPAPRGDYSRTLDAIVQLVTEIERVIGTKGSVGVGIPGTISPATGLVKNSNSTWLIGQPLAADLPRRIERPVRFANDANCFALSEATDGAAAGASVVFGVIVGTGTGGGVVIDGRVVTGANAIAGEWGHNPLPAPRDDERPGPACYCGRSGCIETFLSGPGMARDYAEHAGLPPSRLRRSGEPRRSVSGGGKGPRYEADDIADRAKRGEPLAVACLARYEDRMARALGSIINVLDPAVIVLGGGLSNIDRLYENVPKRWPPYVFSDRVVTRLVRAKHGDASGVRGAAWLWEEET
ncbi:MAG: ROK family protein [Acidobacteria bacterium]|nr:ROK family protein [Acidobacteriota bacterium]